MTQSPSPSPLTWEEAKASTQATEREIVSLIPAEEVAAVDQLPEGSLLSCNEGGHAWLGGTKVTLVPGVHAEDVVRALETRFTDGRFDIRTRRNIDGDYEVQLLATSNERENYIISRYKADDTIDISSASPCFTLPEGVYPGGTF
ncbi:hypothetical protein MTES_2818 [Microbacterium testaceum StLB037]|uniref:Uncharacterized protein n=1 Tax=Microbacterium testaceum (strain StLB037) TaxID=979556 RepID=E8N9D6_MICTS|nr:hypothetical protein [Microbacterium testaceum]BAJ75782.1 hypothetical protein MTES_2818 [Microbacterium testaceum StLB037]